MSKHNDEKGNWLFEMTDFLTQLCGYTTVVN